MSSTPRKLFYLFPWGILILLLLLMTLGLVNLYSATSSVRGEWSELFRSQLLWNAIGLGVLGLMLTHHYRILNQVAVPFYLLTLVLLVLVIVIGKKSGGQQNWLSLGPITLQPSELAKVSLLLMLSRHFSKRSLEGNHRLTEILKPLGIILLPMSLILIEKDLGSALFFVLIGGTYLFVAGVKLRYFMIAFLLAVTLSGVGYRYFLGDYQRGRIQTFLNPESDPRGKGYHLLQSKVAVGSGKVFGKGFLQGDLNKFRFLPERHTDFVYPVLAEEWGFVGSAVVLLLFLSLLLVLLQSSAKLQDPFGGFLVLGGAALIFWQGAINLGGVLGLMPLAGVTLPFFSYGGSATIATMLAMGVACNAVMRRYMF